jgi:hypothetical protein
MEKRDKEKIDKFILPSEEFEMIKACWKDNDILEDQKEKLKSKLEIAKLRLQNLALQAQIIKLNEQILKIDETRIKAKITEIMEKIKEVKIKSTEVGKKIKEEYGIDTSKGVIDENTGEWKSEEIIETIETEE